MEKKWIGKDIVQRKVYIWQGERKEEGREIMGKNGDEKRQNEKIKKETNGK